MSELRGVVYMMKRRGQEQSLVERHKNRYGEKGNYFHISHGKDDLNQSRTVPVIPNVKNINTIQNCPASQLVAKCTRNEKSFLNKVCPYGKLNKFSVTEFTQYAVSLPSS